MAGKILENGREFVALGQDQRRLIFQWGEVHGPEAVEGSAENARLRGFIYDLCRKIAQDYAVVTPSELRFWLAEGEFRNQDDREDFEPHWEVTLTSPKFDGYHRIAAVLSEVAYYAQLPKRPEENYYGAFQVRIDLAVPEELRASQKMVDIQDTMDRMLRLVHGAYQQEILAHYLEWQTDYEPISPIEPIE